MPPPDGGVEEEQQTDPDQQLAADPSVSRRSGRVASETAPSVRERDARQDEGQREAERGTRATRRTRAQRWCRPRQDQNRPEHRPLPRRGAHREGGTEQAPPSRAARAADEARRDEALGNGSRPTNASPEDDHHEPATACTRVRVHRDGVSDETRPGPERDERALLKPANERKAGEKGPGLVVAGLAESPGSTAETAER